MKPRRISSLSGVLLAATLIAETAEAGESREGEINDPLIVVTADRAIIDALAAIPPERTYDPDRIADLGVSSIGEAIDDIMSENGGGDPAILVNGEPTGDPTDIRNYPPEAIARVEVLPTGSASRVDGRAGERVYNIVLKPGLRTASVSAGRQFATEGAYHSDLVELGYTWIKKRDRFNISLQRRSSTLLREGDREIVQPPRSIPYAPAGNVLAFPVLGAEIDPELSALVGHPVKQTAVPSASSNITIADFIATAGLLNLSELERFRSLRPASSAYQLNASGAIQLKRNISLQVSGRMDWSRDRSLSGMPSGLFLVSRDNPANPFSNDFVLAVSDPSRPLENHFQLNGSNFSATLAVVSGSWRFTTIGRFADRSTNFSYDVSSSLTPIILGSERDPFAAPLGPLLRTERRSTGSRIKNIEGIVNAEGPLIRLPAGTLRARAGFSLGRATSDPISYLSENSWYARSIKTWTAGLTIPLVGSSANPLSAIGVIEANFDFSESKLSDGGRLHRSSVGASWQVRSWLRFSGNVDRTSSPIDPEVLAAPVYTAENIRVFDPVQEETVDVRQIYGGNRSLNPETIEKKSFQVSFAPLPKVNLQINAGFTAIRGKDQLGALPATSVPIMMAFPDRFIRDADGRLILVDSRLTNFTSRKQDEVNYSVSFALPLQPNALNKASRPALRATFNHVIALRDIVVIREELSAINLLEGGAIGIGSGRSRHLISGKLSFSDRASGLEVSCVWRGGSTLNTGSASAAQRLHFGSLALLNARAFINVGRLLSVSKAADTARLSFTVNNLINTRQRVVDENGTTPFAYQAAYRDPIGRTLGLDLRITF